MSRLKGLNQITVGFLSLALSACAFDRYRYVPAGVTGQTTDRAQKGKIYYQIPPDAPAGNVRMMSCGIVKLKPIEGGATIPVMDLRMVLSNQTSTVSWLLDPQLQVITFPNYGKQVTPIFTQSSFPTVPNLEVNKGEMKTIDFYFSLPEGETSAKNIQEFDFHWKLKIGSREIDETTSFERISLQTYAEISPYYPYGYYPYGVGGFGWGDPPLVSVAPFSIAPPPSRPVIIGH